MIAAFVVAAGIGEIEKDVAAVGDNLQNTNHVVVGIQTSSCLSWWLKSGSPVGKC